MLAAVDTSGGATSAQPRKKNTESEDCEQKLFYCKYDLIANYCSCSAPH